MLFSRKKRIRKSHTTATFSLFLIFLFLLLAAPAFSQTHPIHISGRLSFPDILGCTPIIPSRTISPHECNVFMKLFDRDTGASLTSRDFAASTIHIEPSLSFLTGGSGPSSSSSTSSNTPPPNTGTGVDPYSPSILRPLSSTIQLSYWKRVPPTTPCSNASCWDAAVPRVLCSQTTIHSDRNGFFDTTIEGCGPGENTFINGEVSLEYPFQNTPGTQIGYVKAIWPHEEVMSAFPNNFVGPPSMINDKPAFTDSAGVHQAIPTLYFTTGSTTWSEPYSDSTHPAHFNIGNRIFFDDDTPSSASSVVGTDYMRQTLSGYQTLIELNYRLQILYGVDNDSYYQKMFPSDLSNTMLLSLFFHGFDSASRGGINVGTAMGGTSSQVGINLFAHEFGHVMHASLAPSAFGHDYWFQSLYQLPSALIPTYGPGESLFGIPGVSIGPQPHSIGYQEFETALSEGLASALGNYLLNGCRKDPSVNGFNDLFFDYATYRYTDDFSVNPWNADVSCDGHHWVDSTCGFQSIRAQLSAVRGIVEGSPEWNTRIARLRALTALGISAHQGVVTSNQELRYAEFFCDLLATDVDASRATGIAGRQYLPDFTYLVGEILNGNTPVLDNSILKTYSANAVPDIIHMSLGDLMDALQNICPDCSSHLSAPIPHYGSDYNRSRLSVYTSPISPQNFGLYLVSHRFITRDQLNNVLRANLMEELPDRVETPIFQKTDVLPIKPIGGVIPPDPPFIKSKDEISQPKEINNTSPSFLDKIKNFFSPVKEKK